MHQIDKTVKEIRAVLRPRRALRVVLDAERAVFLAHNAFDRIVQNIDVRHREPRLRNGIGSHCIGVILRSDLDPPCGQILYRVIAAAVTEFQLISLGTISERQDLMAQANAEDRAGAAKCFHGFDRLRHIRGISGAVGDHDPIRIQGSNDLWGSFPWHDRDITSAPVKRAQDVFLHAAVDEDDVEWGRSRCLRRRNVNLSIIRWGAPGFFAADS